MKHWLTGARRLAFALARLATRLLPRERHVWGEAMMAELAHIESEREMILWALGCLGASGRSRIAAWISTSNRRLEMQAKVIRHLGMIAMLAFVSTAGVYAVQKPYQKARIAVWLHQKFGQQASRDNRL